MAIDDNLDYSNDKRAYCRKRKRFERFDGYKVKAIPSFQKLVPYLMKTRDASANYFEETFDVSEVVKYLEEKNKELNNQDLNTNEKSNITKYSYTLFFVALMVRLLALRPNLNRFVARKTIYQRHNIQVSYMVKKNFSDEGEQSTTVETFERDFNIEDVGKILFDSIEGVKETTNDATGGFISTLMKFPNFIVTFVVWIFDALVYIGYCPAILRKIDAMQCSVMFSNLGSIGLTGAPHHHLYDRGTCSLLVSTGKVRKDKILVDGKLEEKDVVDIKISMDERIADGFYFVQSFKILNDILKNPYQLDERLKELKIDE
ncbi:hypothetical protein [Methanobrevibacter curvatus]|uniref:2-oxoacid dehydrogenases acyltransferase n=1 Tax=Methanobrevibacter curvatus TaxID=49547 RepID=A0A162FDQ5_9EURY|nr:hypothetical protein [Methanobrevibacter curvatus]KZX11515.1 2-oxoacid dehydrogenases acyltransferase [Methanobrevibacter curvatus]